MMVVSGEKRTGFGSGYLLLILKSQDFTGFLERRLCSRALLRQSTAGKTTAASRGARAKAQFDTPPREVGSLGALTRVAHHAQSALHRPKNLQRLASYPGRVEPLPRFSFTGDLNQTSPSNAAQVMRRKCHLNVSNT